MKLTAGERRVLEFLAAGETRELTQAIPGGWWLGDVTDDTVEDEQVDGRIGFSLLRKVLVRCSYDDNRGTYWAYQINEDGRKLLADPNYVTQMQRHYRGLKN